MPNVDERIRSLDGKLEQRLTQSAAALLLGSVFALLVTASNEALARIGKCTMGSLTPAEESLLLATASRILPKHAGLVVSNLCGSTSAEITTQKIATRHGVSHWWVAHCRRDSREWVCDPVQLQEVEKRLIIRGTPLQVAMTFDEGTVPEAVESVATRALSIYADPGSQLPLCGGIKDPGNRWTTLRKEHPLQEGKVRVQVTAQQYGTWAPSSSMRLFSQTMSKSRLNFPLLAPINRILALIKRPFRAKSAGLAVPVQWP
jgi:hypothetical protein